jgi:hypothetical protein
MSSSRIYRINNRKYKKKKRKQKLADVSDKD